MTKYTGGCHCGAVRYEADTDINEVLSCNCSICTKRGTLLAFMPESNFTLIQGGGALTDYQFGKKMIHHLFCRTCGILSFGKGIMPDGTPTVAINVRCLDDVDLEQFPVKKFDGRSL